MRKNRIRLTESRLRGMIREAVKSALKEDFGYGDDAVNKLTQLSKDSVFNYLLNNDIFHLRIEHYAPTNNKNGYDPDDMTSQKVFDNIEQAIQFIESSSDPSFVYIDPTEYVACVNLFDLPI